MVSGFRSREDLVLENLASSRNFASRTRVLCIWNSSSIKAWKIFCVVMFTRFKPGRANHESFSTTTSQCRAGTSRRPDSLSSSTVGLVLALSFRPSSLSGTSRKSKRTRGTRGSLCTRVIWAGRTFTTLEELNRQALLWRDQVAHQRLGRTMILAPCSKLSS